MAETETEKTPDDEETYDPDEETGDEESEE
jgi:hypothetical protein